MRRTFILAIAVLAIAPFLQLGSSVANAGACTDPTPGDGGELQLEGVGTPIHTATQFGEVCPSDSETWFFATFDVPVDQWVGYKVVEEQGPVSITVQRNSDTPVALAPGDAYRNGEPSGQPAATYSITITGGGTELASYRVEACRSIYDPCAFANSGDATCDDSVDSLDALAVLQSNAGLMFLICAHMADVNNSGSIDAVDALLLLQRVVGLIGELPIA